MASIMPSFLKRFHQSPETSEKTKKKRKEWGGKAEFLLATTGYCVGQGALTRFPYVCMKNGGGAFIIPFLIAIATVTGPICYLEMLLGQFSGQSALTVWSLCPAFKGLGYTTVLSAYYLFSSFRVELPWQTCQHEWNSIACQETSINGFNSTNFTSLVVNQTKVSSASEEFWNYHVLGLTPEASLENIGSVHWHLAVTNLICWVTVFLCTMKGAQSTGKVVLVTATLPFVLLIVLLFRGVTLDGSLQGVVYFLNPDLSKLANFDIWLEAFLQAFYQTAIGWGGLITMASYNKFNRRCHWDAILMLTLNCIFTMIGGIAVFSVFGFMAEKYNVDVEDVAASGPGLAFVAYPEALTHLPLPQFWSAAFFLTLITVAIDSLFGTFEVVVCGILDVFPHLRHWQILTTAVCSIFMYLISLGYCTEGGMYLYQIIDWYGFAFTYLIVCFSECIIVSYIYGIKRFFSDTELMFGSAPNKVLAISWMVFAPIVLLVLAISVFVKLEKPTYGFTNYSYPDWSVALCWSISIACFLPTPVVLIATLIRTPGTLKDKFNYAFSPRTNWIPNRENLVEDYKKRWYGLGGETMSVKGDTGYLNEAEFPMIDEA